MSAPQNEKNGEQDRPKPEYDRSTLLMAAALFISFCLFIFFLPQIMLLIGGQNRFMAGGLIALTLVFPFAGFWLRGRMRRAQK